MSYYNGRYYPPRYFPPQYYPDTTLAPVPRAFCAHSYDRALLEAVCGDVAMFEAVPSDRQLLVAISKETPC